MVPQPRESTSFNNASAEKTKNTSQGRSNSTLDVGIPFNNQIETNQMQLEQQATLLKEQIINQPQKVQPQLSNVLLPYPDEAYNVSQSQASLQNVIQNESDKRVTEAARQVNNKNYDEEFSLSKITQTQLSYDWSAQDKSQTLSQGFNKTSNINDGNLLFNVDEEISLRSTRNDTRIESTKESDRNSINLVQKPREKGLSEAQSNTSELNSDLKSSTHFQTQYKAQIDDQRQDDVTTSTSFDHHLTNKNQSIDLGETNTHLLLDKMSNQITKVDLLNDTDQNDIIGSFNRKNSFQSAINQNQILSELPVLYNTTESFADAIALDQDGSPVKSSIKPNQISSYSTFQPIHEDQNQVLISRSQNYIQQCADNSYDEPQKNSNTQDSAQLARNLSQLSDSFIGNFDRSQQFMSTKEDGSKVPQQSVSNILLTEDYTPISTMFLSSPKCVPDVDKSPNQTYQNKNIDLKNCITPRDPRQVSLSDVFKTLSSTNQNEDFWYKGQGQVSAQNNQQDVRDLGYENQENGVDNESTENFELHDSMLANNSRIGNLTSSQFYIEESTDISRSQAQSSKSKATQRDSSQQISGYKDLHGESQRSLRKFQLTKGIGQQPLQKSDQPQQSDIDTLSSADMEKQNYDINSTPKGTTDMHLPQTSNRSLEMFQENKKEVSQQNKAKVLSSIGVQADFELNISINKVYTTFCQVECQQVINNQREVSTQFAVQSGRRSPFKKPQDIDKIPDKQGSQSKNMILHSPELGNKIQDSRNQNYSSSQEPNQQDTTQLFINQSISLRNPLPSADISKNAARSDFDKFHQQFPSNQKNPVNQLILEDQPQGSTSNQAQQKYTQSSDNYNSGTSPQTSKQSDTPKKNIRNSTTSKDIQTQQVNMETQGRRSLGRQNSEQNINDLLHNVSEVDTENVGSQLYNLSKPTLSQFKPSTQYSSMQSFLSDPFENKSKVNNREQKYYGSSPYEGSNTSLKVSNMFPSQGGTPQPLEEEPATKYEDVQDLQDQSSGSLDYSSGVEKSASFHSISNYQLQNSFKRAPSKSNLSNKYSRTKIFANDKDDKQSFKSFDSMENSISQARSFSISQLNALSIPTKSDLQQPSTELQCDQQLSPKTQVASQQSMYFGDSQITNNINRIVKQVDILGKGYEKDCLSSSKLRTDSDGLKEEIQQSFRESLDNQTQRDTIRDLPNFLRPLNSKDQSFVAHSSLQKTQSIDADSKFDIALISNQPTNEMPKNSNGNLAQQGLNFIQSYNFEESNHSHTSGDVLKSPIGHQTSINASKLFRNDPTSPASVNNQQQKLNNFYKSQSVQIKSTDSVSSLRIISESRNQQDEQISNSNSAAQSRIEQLLQQQAEYQQHLHKQSTFDKDTIYNNSYHSLDNAEKPAFQKSLIQSKSQNQDNLLDFQQQTKRAVSRATSSRLQHQASRVQKDDITDTSQVLNSTLQPEKSVQISYSALSDEELLNELDSLKQEIIKSGRNVGQLDLGTRHIQSALSKLSMNQPQIIIPETKIISSKAQQEKGDHKLSQHSSQHSLYSNALYDKKEQLKSSPYSVQIDVEGQSQMLDSQQLSRSNIGQQSDLLDSNNLQPEYFKGTGAHINYVSDVYEDETPQLSFTDSKEPSFRKQEATLYFDNLNHEDKLTSEQLDSENEPISSINPSFLQNSNFSESAYPASQFQSHNESNMYDTLNSQRTRRTNLISTNIDLNGLDPHLLPRFGLNRREPEQNIKTRDGDIDTKLGIRSNVNSAVNTKRTINSQVVNPLEQLNSLFHQDNQSLRSLDKASIDSANNSRSYNSQHGKKSSHISFDNAASGKYSSHTLNSRKKGDMATNIEQVVAQFDVPKHLPDDRILQTQNMSNIASEIISSSDLQSQMTLLNTNQNIRDIKGKSSLGKSQKNIKFDSHNNIREADELTNNDVYTIWDVNDLSDIEKQIKAVPKDHNANMIQAMMQRLSQKKQEISSQVPQNVVTNSREIPVYSRGGNSSRRS